MLLVSIDLAICLIDRCALAAHTLGHSNNLWRIDNSLIIINSSDAVVVRVTDVDFDITTGLVVE